MVVQKILDKLKGTPKEVCCEKYKTKGKLCRRCPKNPEILLKQNRSEKV
jgi:hypothetical protein